jgi:hypothetical protein
MLESGVAIAEKRALVPPLELLGRMLGFFAAATVVEEAGEITVGAFYRRWNGIEEYREDLTRHILARAFDPVRLRDLLQAQLMPVLEQPATDLSSLIDSYQDGCATAAAEDSPYPYIRWLAYPHIEALGIDRSKSTGSAAAFLGVIHKYARVPLPSESERGIQAVDFLLQVDLEAIKLASSNTD